MRFLRNAAPCWVAKSAVVVTLIWVAIAMAGCAGSSAGQMPPAEVPKAKAELPPVETARPTCACGTRDRTEPSTVPPDEEPRKPRDMIAH
jgi:hypothetical protein